MMSLNDLDCAMILAMEAHADHVDEIGHPYFIHLVRVMMAMTSYDEKIVAILHDITGCTQVNLEDLKEREFSSPVIEALECLSYRMGEPDDEYLERVYCNPISRRVKLADLDDHIYILKSQIMNEKTRKRLDKYQTDKEWMMSRIEQSAHR